MFIDYFTLFGLDKTYQIAPEAVKERFLELQKKFHPDNFVNAIEQEKRLAQEYAATINEAYQTLSCPLQRAIYLLKLQGIDALNEKDTSMPMEFLEEQMELREKLAKFENIPLLQEKVQSALSSSEQEISKLFEQKDKFDDVRLVVRKMQFYETMRDEILSISNIKR